MSHCRTMTFATPKARENLARIRKLAASKVSPKQMTERMGMHIATVRKYIQFGKIKVTWRDPLIRECLECGKKFTNPTSYNEHLYRRSKRYPKRPITPRCRTTEEMVAAGYKPTARGWLKIRRPKLSGSFSALSSPELQSSRPQA